MHKRSCIGQAKWWGIFKLRSHHEQLSKSYYKIYEVVSGGNNNLYTGVFNVYLIFFQLKNDILIILRKGYVRSNEFCCDENILVCNFCFCIREFSHL